MSKKYARMRKGSIIILLLAALLVSASVTRKDGDTVDTVKVVSEQPKKLTKHIAPEEKLPDYKRFYSGIEKVKHEKDSLKRENKKFNDSVFKSENKWTLATAE